MTENPDKKDKKRMRIDSDDLDEQNFSQKLLDDSASTGQINRKYCKYELRGSDDQLITVEEPPGTPGEYQNYSIITGSPSEQIFGQE